MKETKIYYALDKNQDPIDIRSAKQGESYHCIGCGQPLTIKAENSTRVHKYFSHLPGAECDYAKNHDMSEWHYMWQSRFPGCCEIPMPNKSNPIHRADVCVWGRVIEFQHSPISEEEFKSRNEFYPNQVFGVTIGGIQFSNICSLVWIFDMNGHVKKIEDGYIKLKKRNDLFRGYNVELSRYTLFFENEERLYRIAGMDEVTGWYYLLDNNSIDKDTFSKEILQPPKLFIPKPTGKSSVNTKKTPAYCLPGIKKAIGHGYKNGRF